MKHLQGGVKKGAFDEAEAQRRFDAWKSKKTAVTEAFKSDLASKKASDAKQRFEDEQAKNKAKAEAVAKKKAELAAAAAPAEETPAEEVAAESAE